MDFSKAKRTFFKTCTMGLMALTLASCMTNKRVEVSVPEQSAVEYNTQEMPKTTNDVQPKVVAADEAIWADIEERQKQQDLIRQALEEAERLEQERIEKERIEAERIEVERLKTERLEQERLESERLEAERLETERLEAERLEKERLEAEQLAKEQDLTKETKEEEANAAVTEPEKENPLAYILEDIKPESNTEWSVAGEDSPVYIPQSNEGDATVKERNTEFDRILSGNSGNQDIPSWLLSPKEQETISGGNLQVVNIYQPLEEEKTEDTVTPEDILELGSMYTSDREEKASVKDMNKEQLIQKAIELLNKGIPYIGIGFALLLILFVIKFLKKQINPIKKKTHKEQEGVEVIADGFMVSRPGQGKEPDIVLDEEKEEPTAAPAAPDAKQTEPVREKAPETDPRGQEGDKEKEKLDSKLSSIWKPVNKASDYSSNEEDDEDYTPLVPD